MSRNINVMSFQALPGEGKFSGNREVSKEAKERINRFLGRSLGKSAINAANVSH